MGTFPVYRCNAQTKRQPCAVPNSKHGSARAFQHSKWNIFNMIKTKGFFHNFVLGNSWDIFDDVIQKIISLRETPGMGNFSQNSYTLAKFTNRWKQKLKIGNSGQFFFRHPSCPTSEWWSFQIWWRQMPLCACSDVVGSLFSTWVSHALCDIRSSGFISKDCVGICKTKLTTHMFLLYIRTFHILLWCPSPFFPPPLFLLKPRKILLCLEMCFENHHFVQFLVLLKFWM